MTDASSSPSNPRLRWFQFSLRTAMIVVTLVAGLLAGWRVYNEPYRRQREVMAYILDLRGGYQTEPGGPSWLRGLFSEDSFPNIIEISLFGDRVSDASLVRLEGLANLQVLRLCHTQVSDVGLARLRGFTILRLLDLECTPVSDAGLAHLEGLANLKMLYLTDTKVSDAGLAHLKGLTNLQKIWLGHTRVSDAGLVHLNGLTNLQKIWLGHTRVSAAGAKKLQKALPKCHVYMTHYTLDRIY